MSHPAFTRRDVLELGGVAALARLGAAASASALLASRAGASAIGPLLAEARVRAAYRLREDAAAAQARKPLPAHPDNGDESLYADLRASYSKGLPHGPLGEVDPAAYAMMRGALASGMDADFEAIPLGGAVKLTSPQAAFAFEMNGPDGHHTSVPPPPRFASAERAGEAVELYWQALTRDVPFEAYATDPLIA